MIILKRFKLVFATVLLAVLGLLLLSTDSFAASDDIFSVDVTGGAEYEGYIFKLKDNAEIKNSLDNEIDTVYEPQNIYSATTIEEIKNNVNADDIEYIEPNYLMSIDDALDAYTYNDPYYSLQWGIQFTRGDSALNYGLSGKGVVVGVIDTGLKSHEDIDPSYIRTGKNFLDGSTDTTDNYGHGTKVTSVIAATNNNGKGIASLAYQATIVPLKVSNTGFNIQTTAIVSAIYEAVDTYGCDVINMSICGPAISATEKSACDYAASKDVLFISSVGNDYSSTLKYPAAFDSVIGVGAITSDGVRADYSNYSSAVFVTAPGSNIYMASNTSSTSYAYANGTSFSTPYIASLAALAKGYDNSMTLSEFQTLLKSSAVDKGTSGYDTSYGWGVVDVGRFVCNLTGNDFFNFTDVSSSYYAKSSIDYCVRYGMFGGTSPTTFSPENNIARADLITALGRFYEMSGGSIAVKDDSFSDTVNGSYYSKYVAWASASGIVGGYGNGRFGPKDGATREQMAIILYRYAVYSGMSIDAVDLSVLNNYTDQASISSYARTEMAWCIRKGLIAGTSPTTLSPTNMAVRAHVAVILQRYAVTYSSLAGSLSDLAA